MSRFKRCAASEMAFAIEQRDLDVDAGTGDGSRGGLLGGSRDFVTERNTFAGSMRESFRRRVGCKNACLERGRCARSARKSRKRVKIDCAALGMQIQQPLPAWSSLPLRRRSLPWVRRECADI